MTQLSCPPEVEDEGCQAVAAGDAPGSRPARGPPGALQELGAALGDWVARGLQQWRRNWWGRRAWASKSILISQ